MKNFISVPRVLLAISAAALLFCMVPAQAQQSTNTQSSTPDQSDPTAGWRPVTTHLPQAAPPPPPPASAPSTTKQGDDLVVHLPSGDQTYQGFMKSIAPGEEGSISIELPNRGVCQMKIDSNGAVVAMTCQH